jgi:protein O-mannosyl-transferase
MEDQTVNPYRDSSATEQPLRWQPVAEAVILSPANWARDLLIGFALAALIVTAYWGVWGFDFVYFDDPGYVTDNLNVVRGLPLFKDNQVFRSSVSWAFTAFEQSNWHPLTWLSHMLDVQLYGLNAGGHHVTNLIFHLCNTLLVFCLLRWMTERSWCSAIVAALFAVHPMHVESVAWVAERKDVLSTFLALLTLLIYAWYSRKARLAIDSLVLFGVLSAFTWLLTLLCFSAFRGLHPETFRFSLLWGYIPIFVGVLVYAVVSGRYQLLLYCAIFVLYAVGLLAKPMLVTLPCVCLLLDFWPLGRFDAVVRSAPRPIISPERPQVLRRRAKRNQRLPVQRATTPIEGDVFWSAVSQILLLLMEKLPLLALSACSAIITPFAQAHGGSMATTAELSLAFRIENSLQSYLTYITRMFWPGKMSVLYLLDPDHVNHWYTAAAATVVVLITGLVIWAALSGRRYLAVGWFWYVGTLVPVIGIVQVGEQTHADRYTYIPYIGLFIMLAWGTADLISLLPTIRGKLQFAAGSVVAIALVTCVVWTKYQLQFWTDVETHLRHALTITPDNWNMLNNLGVYLWKEAQKQDVNATAAEARGDTKTAKACREKSLELKNDAKSQWNHGIAARPTATDIHSNLGYAYSEANDLDKAEQHLTQAVTLKPISPRPHNNLGRVLLRRSQKNDADAAKAESKVTDPAEAAKAKLLRAEAKAKLNSAIVEFEKAVQLDPSLLEARLNLGEVYIALNDLDKAESQYKEILNLRSESVKDRETISNFSQGSLGLARVALARKDSDQAVAYLQQALALNPQNISALQLLAMQRLQRGEYRQAERCLWPLLAALTKEQRRELAKQLGGQFAAGKSREAFVVWNFFAWAFATSPEPHILDPEESMVLAKVVVDMTRQQDPLSLDTLAAAQAACGQYPQAVQSAQAAFRLANSQGNRPLAEAIARRLSFYLQGKPYRCDPNGSDRP